MKMTLILSAMLRRPALIMAAILCTAAPSLACSPPAGAAEIQARLASWTNSERAKAGLPKLAMSSQLDAAAQFHACNMVKRDFYGHNAPGGPSFKTRLKREGYRIATAVENLGRSTEYSLSAPVRMWTDSPEHRTNTMNPNIREMGFGTAMDAQGRAYYVFIGAAPR